MKQHILKDTVEFSDWHQLMFVGSFDSLQRCFRELIVLHASPHQTDLIRMKHHHGGVLGEEVWQEFLRRAEVQQEGDNPSGYPQAKSEKL